MLKCSTPYCICTIDKKSSASVLAMSCGHLCITCKIYSSLFSIFIFSRELFPAQNTLSDQRK